MSSKRLLARSSSDASTYTLSSKVGPDIVSSTTSASSRSISTRPPSPSLKLWDFTNSPKERELESNPGEACTLATSDSGL